MGAMSIQNKRIARKYISGKLTAEQAMEQAGVSKVTLYNWKKNAEKIKVKRPRKKNKVAPNVNPSIDFKTLDVPEVVYKLEANENSLAKKILKLCLEELGI